jgi:hypothetical protein
MDIYELGEDFYDERFARAMVVWDDTNAIKCPRCKRRERSSYAIGGFQWNFGRYDNFTEEIADFVWPTTQHDIMLVRNDVKPVIEELLSEAEFRKVEIVAPKKKAQKTPQKSPPRKQRVLNPTEGLPLWQVTTQRVVHMDLDSSGQKIIEQCPTCGVIQYSIEPHSQIVIRASELKDATLFHLKEFGGPSFFVTETIATPLTNCHFTNLKMRKVGAVAP